MTIYLYIRRQIKTHRKNKQFCGYNMEILWEGKTVDEKIQEFPESTSSF